MVGECEAGRRQSRMPTLWGPVAMVGGFGRGGVAECAARRNGSGGRKAARARAIWSELGIDFGVGWD